MNKSFIPFIDFIRNSPLGHHSSRVIRSNDDLGLYKATVLPSKMYFGTQTPNSTSAVQTGVITNVGKMALPIKAIIGVGDWVVSSNCPAILAPGQSAEISIAFAPKQSGPQTGGVYVDTGDAGGTEFIQLFGVGAGTVIVDPPDPEILPTLSISDGAISILGSAIMTAYPSGTVELATYTFGDTELGTSSVATIRALATGNVTYTTLPSIVGAFTATYGNPGNLLTAPVSLTDGQALRINLSYTPTAIGSTSSVLSLVSNSETTSITLEGAAVSPANAVPIILGVPSTTVPITVGVAYALTNFTIADTDNTSVVVTFTSNNGTISGITDSDLTTSGIQVSGTLSEVNAAISNMVFTAAAVGAAHVGISVSDGVNTPSTAAYTFTAELAGALPRVSILGNQFMANGSPIRLKAVNWFGAETATMVPHGLWARTWKPILTQIKSMGFNCIRLPFSRQGFANMSTIPTDNGALGIGQGPGGTDLNPDLIGLTVYEIFDLIIEECRLNGLYVILDHHRNGYDAHEAYPVTATYNEAGWHALWGQMATRYGNNTTVIGADLYNEPASVWWPTLATLYEGCGNHIHTIAPNWIIFCEGGADDGTAQNNFWMGGNLENVRTRPVTLTLPNKVAYAPHEYGLSVFHSPWLKYAGNDPVNWPTSMYDKRRNHYSFIFEEGIAPILVGEFGGKFGYGDDGLVTGADYVYEREWLTTLINHMNGDFNGDGVTNLTGNQLGMSFAYWSFNVNSGDTGGLVQTDWITEQAGKLALIAPLF